MKAAWYDKQGTAHDVLVVGEMDEPQPLAGEVRIRIAASGINPGDVKKRSNAFGYGMSYPRVIPHSDGAGTVDAVGEGVSQEWIGRRVWCYGAQTYRAFGTAAQYTVVPLPQAVPLPENVSMEQGACLGIPVITAHRAGARVIATCRSESTIDVAKRAGADEVLLTNDELVKQIRKLAPGGVDHIIEVDFGAIIKNDVDLLPLGGSIASYASSTFEPEIPFWLLVFSNLRLFFIGSDDVPAEAKLEATKAVNEALAAGWQGFDIAKRFSLDEISQAHEFVEHPEKHGRVIVTI